MSGEHGILRLVRVDVTAHPSLGWTLQQLREVIGLDDTHRYLIQDLDSLFARHLDESIKALGLTVLKSPPRCPKANAICERVIGTIRRECLDWLSTISESHLRLILKFEMLDSTLQPRKTAQPPRPRSTRSAAHTGDSAKCGIPPSAGGRALLCSQDRYSTDCLMNIR